MVQVVSHHRSRLVQELGGFFLRLAPVDDFRQEVGIVSAAGFDELLLDGGALHRQIKIEHR